MKKNTQKYILGFDGNSIKTTYKKLQRAVTGILGKNCDKYLVFSIFESVEEKGETWYVKAPDIWSPRNVFAGKVMMPCGHYVPNPTWKDIILAASLEVGIDHCYLEDVSVVDGKIKFCFGS